MTLTEIHARTHLSLAQLRYVLDNELVPGAKEASDGRGTARNFRPAMAVLVALAAAMVENHLRAPFVGRFISMLAQNKSLILLEVKPINGQCQLLQIAGPSYVRAFTNADESSQSPSRWIDLRTKATLDVTFHPLVYISIDFAELRRQVLG